MKLILSSDETEELFNSESPSVQEVLENKAIKQITKGFNVTSIYKDRVNTANLNNYVIELEVKSDGN